MNGRKAAGSTQKQSQRAASTKANKKQKAKPKQVVKDPQLKAKPLPQAAKLHTQYRSESTQSFETSPFHYRQVPSQHADAILMDDEGARRQHKEMLHFIDSPLLDIKDPVLRETIRQVENSALKNDRVRENTIRTHLLSNINANVKVKKLIQDGASNRTVLNAMYNLFPRIMPTRRLRHNVDNLDWVASIRHRWQNEIEPNGYDVEDSSDPDTLPQQRPFTRDEMNRLLQDVEEAKYIESDVEEALFAPTAAIADLRREIQQVEVNRQLRFVLKNVHGTTLTPETFDYKAMRREFKQLLGAPLKLTPEEHARTAATINEEEDASPEIDELMTDLKGDGKPNQLSHTLRDTVLSHTQLRRNKYGQDSFLPGADIGRLDAEEFLIPGTITNAGLGLMPPVFDITELPLEYHQPETQDNRIDVFEDVQRPFQTRFDIACAVVLNKIMGTSAKDIPLYLTDSIDAETRLVTHPAFQKARFAMLQDLKNGSNTSVESVQKLMKSGFHPQDIMKRLLLQIDSIVNTSDIEQVGFDASGEITQDPDSIAILFNSDDIDKLADYRSFILEAMKTAQVFDAAAEFGTDPTVDGNGKVSFDKRPVPDQDPGAAPQGLLHTSMNKPTFASTHLSTGPDGAFMSIHTVTTDAHPEGMVLRSQLKAQEPGIGNVHRISPESIDLSNNLGIDTTTPLASPFGFRPNQRTIYGKQIFDEPHLDNDFVGGLASHEVPATRFTTDGTEISLDPHRSKAYTPNELKAHLDHYDEQVKGLIVYDQLMAKETAAIFAEEVPNTLDLFDYHHKHDPDQYFKADYSEQSSDIPTESTDSNTEKSTGGHSASDVDMENAIYPVSNRGQNHLRNLMRGKQEYTDYSDLQKQGENYSDRTDIDNDNGNDGPATDRTDDFAPGLAEFETAATTPHKTLERFYERQRQQKELDDLLHNPILAQEDINWKPLNNFSVAQSYYMITKLETKHASKEKKFREVCAAAGLELTAYDSEFNNLVRRVFDGEVKQQLTDAARAATKEEQLALLAPVLNDWKYVVQTERANLLYPLGVEAPQQRLARKQYTEDYVKKLFVVRNQLFFTYDVDRYGWTEDLGYAAVEHGAVPTELIEFPQNNTQNQAPMTTTDGKLALPHAQIVVGGKYVAKPIRLRAPPNASKSTFANTNTYTLLDLFEGKVKIGPGDGAPAITDFDFRSHYLTHVAQEVGAFNAQYYTTFESDNFDEIVKNVPGASNFTPSQMKILRAKSQVGPNKFSYLKRNDTPYAEGDYDEKTHTEIKIQSLDVADVNEPLSDSLLKSIKKNYRVMLRTNTAGTNSPLQTDFNIDAYLTELNATGGDRDAAFKKAEEVVSPIPDQVIAKQLKRYLQAWRAEDDNEAVHVHTRAMHAGDDIDQIMMEAQDDEAVNISLHNHVVDEIQRKFAKSLYGQGFYSNKEIREYMTRVSEGTATPADELNTALALAATELIKHEMLEETTKSYRQESSVVAYEMALEKKKAADEDAGPAGFKLPFRTPDKIYQRTMDMAVDGDDMDRLRSQLSKDILDPTHEINVDDRVEWFNEPELLQAFDSKTILTALDDWVNNDPFLRYLDRVPDGVKEAEVLRSSFSLIPPRLLDEAIRSRKGDERSLVGRRRNLIRYNPAFSYRQLRRYRRGLEKYSGIPHHLLDFAEVAFNPSRPFFVHASREENHLREMMTEERLRQPGKALVEDRPVDSDAEVPSISTPITIGGVPANRQAARIQHQYKSVFGTDRYDRIEQFKKDLNRPLQQNTFLLSDTEIPTEELDIAQDFFEKSLDRLLERDGTEFATSEYDMDVLRAEYAPEIQGYAKIKRKMQLISDNADQLQRTMVPRDEDGDVVDPWVTRIAENGMVLPLDTDEEEEYTAKTKQKTFDKYPHLDPKLKEAELQKKSLAREEKADFDAQNDPANADNSDSDFGLDHVTPAPNDLSDWDDFESSKRHVFDDMHHFDDYLANVARYDDDEGEGFKQITFAQRVAAAQAKQLKFNDPNFYSFKRDPEGKEVALSKEYEMFFDNGVPRNLGDREKQALAIYIQGSVRHRRAHPDTAWQPHEYETAIVFERIYGLSFFDTPAERKTARSSYLTYVRDQRAIIKTGQDDETANAQKSFDPEIAQVAEEESENPVGAEAKRKQFLHKTRTNLRAAQGSDDSSEVSAQDSDVVSRADYEDLLGEDALHEHAQLQQEDFEMNNIAGDPIWDDKTLFNNRNPFYHTKTRHILERNDNGQIGVGELYDSLNREEKVKFLLELIEQRHQRELRAGRRDDIVATLYGTQRQLLRRLTDELQIVKRSERTAFKRIFALDPQYARELVAKQLLYSTGRQLHGEDSNRPLWVNWKVELNYVEEIMWASANRLNARTGGMFPGAPNVNEAHDPTKFTPPAIITGEFAPMFIDRHMVSSGDEYVDPTTRLDHHANADFTVSSVLEHRTKSQRRVSHRDESHLDDDSKPVFNTRPYVTDAQAREAKLQILEEFSQYDFTSDAEMPLIENSLAQLNLDASTNIAFASAIAARTQHLNDRRAKIESKYELMYGQFDPNTNYRAAYLFQENEDNVVQKDGLMPSKFNLLRHRLKSLMHSKSQLSLLDSDAKWDGLYEDVDIGDGDQDVKNYIEAVSKVFERSRRVPMLSPGALLNHPDMRSYQGAEDQAEADQFLKSEINFQPNAQLVADNDLPFDPNGVYTQSFKTKTIKSVDAALDKAANLKSQANTDVMDVQISSSAIPKRFSHVDVSNLDEATKKLVLAEQAHDRHRGANAILQANALVLRSLGFTTPESEDVLAHWDGATDLLSQEQVDDIIHRSLGGQGGAQLLATSDEFIEPFVRSPHQIVGEFLELARPSGKHHVHRATYNLARTAEEIEADVKKIEAGEMTEWTDFELAGSEVEQHIDEKPAYERFSGALNAMAKLTQPKMLRKITRSFDDGRGPEEAGISTKQIIPDSAGKFNPDEHMAKILTNKYALDKNQKRIPRVFSTPSDDSQTDLFDKMEVTLDAGDIEIEYAPGGRFIPPAELDIPANATKDDIDRLLDLDHGRFVRPAYQTLSPYARSKLKHAIPRWMRETTDTRPFIKQYVGNNDEVITILNPQFPTVTDSMIRTVESSAAEGGIDAASIKPAGLPSKMIKIQREKFITPKEASAMGLNPNDYQGELTRMQKEFVSERIDQFFGSTEWADEVCEGLRSNKYIRSLMMFTGLRRLEADPTVGSQLVTHMLHGADIADESTLYPHLNVQNFYRLVRTIEKEERLERMGLLDKFVAAASLPADKQKDPSANPMLQSNQIQRKEHSPTLELIRDIVVHSEAYAQITAGTPPSPKQDPKYNPLTIIKDTNPHKRIQEEYSGNESDFETVNAVSTDLRVKTVPSLNADHTAIHAAMVTAKKNLSGLSVEEVEKIFEVAEQHPEPLRTAILSLLRAHLQAHPASMMQISLHIKGINSNEEQLHTAHELRNRQIMDMKDAGDGDPHNPRRVFTLEEMDLSLVDMSQRFDAQFQSGLPLEDLTAFNTIIIDCAREARVLYPKPKLHEIAFENDENTVGFDTEKLAIGKLEQFDPKDLRFSSDSVSVETFNRIMSLPAEKLQTFLRYLDFVHFHADQIADRTFFKQLNSDIRAVRPLPDELPENVGAAQHIRKMHKERSKFDHYNLGPSGYIRIGAERLDDDRAVADLIMHSRHGRTAEISESRIHEDGATTEDPAYNFRNVATSEEYYDQDAKTLVGELYRDQRDNVPVDLYSGLDDSSGEDLSHPLLEDVPAGDRPEDDDLSRRFLNMQEYMSDPLNPRQVSIMKQIYEERRLDAYWRGTMSPFDSAEVYNNLRMADKMMDNDTFQDHDRELARLHREIVVGVVREVMDDQDVYLNSLEFDSYNLEPDFTPSYNHFDHINLFAARRFSPYTTLPLSESNIPPMIGIEQQRNVYNLHLLDPVTFHPRWLARRLNISYAQCIAILKTYDFRHRVNMDEVLHESDIQYASDFDDIDDAPINPDFENVDINLPNPPEIQLGQLDEEYLYARFAPNLIGRVSWTKRQERDPSRVDSSWRDTLGFQYIFGGDGHAKYSDQLETTLSKRYMEEEQQLDALEQAAFARFGPISWQTTQVGDLHRPPKLPREIISASLHPPSRANWALTTLDESRKATFGIMVRDRDGYLRHPTYREFKNIRLREKDARTVFNWRRHHVLGKLPEISSLFIDQVTRIKTDFDAKMNLAKDMRSTYDLNFVRQIEHTPIVPLSEVEADRLSNGSTTEGFERNWQNLSHVRKQQGRHDNTTLRARDWLGEYDEESMPRHANNLLTEIDESEYLGEDQHKAPHIKAAKYGLTPRQSTHDEADIEIRNEKIRKMLSNMMDADDNEETIKRFIKQLRADLVVSRFIKANPDANFDDTPELKVKVQKIEADAGVSQSDSTDYEALTPEQQNELLFAPPTDQEPSVSEEFPAVAAHISLRRSLRTPGIGLSPLDDPDRVTDYSFDEEVGGSGAEEAEKIYQALLPAPEDLEDLGIPPVPSLDIRNHTDFTGTDVKFMAVASPEEIHQWCTGSMASRIILARRLVNRHAVLSAPDVFAIDQSDNDQNLQSLFFDERDYEITRNLARSNKLQDYASEEFIKTVFKSPTAKEAALAPHVDGYRPTSPINKLKRELNGVVESPEMFHYRKILNRYKVHDDDIYEDHEITSFTEVTNSDDYVSSGPSYDESSISTELDQILSPTRFDENATFDPKVAAAQLKYKVKKDAYLAKKFGAPVQVSSDSDQQVAEFESVSKTLKKRPIVGAGSDSELPTAGVEEEQKAQDGQASAATSATSAHPTVIESSDNDFPSSSSSSQEWSDIENIYKRDPSLHSSPQYEAIQQTKILRKITKRILRAENRLDPEMEPRAYSKHIDQMVIDSTYPGLNVNDPDFEQQLTARQYRETHLDDPLVHASFLHRSDGQIPKHLATDHMREYLTSGSEELEYYANGGRGKDAQSFITRIKPIRTPHGAFFLEQNSEIERALEGDSDDFQLPMSLGDVQKVAKALDSPEWMQHARDLGDLSTPDDKTEEQSMVESEPSPDSHSSQELSVDSAPETEKDFNFVHRNVLQDGSAFNNDESSEGPFFDNHFGRKDVYQKLYGTSKHKLTPVQREHVADIRATLNDQRNTRLSKLSEQVSAGQRTTRSVIRQATYDPQQITTQAMGITVGLSPDDADDVALSRIGISPKDKLDV